MRVGDRRFGVNREKCKRKKRRKEGKEKGKGKGKKLNQWQEHPVYARTFLGLSTCLKLYRTPTQHNTT